MEKLVSLEPDIVFAESIHEKTGLSVSERPKVLYVIWYQPIWTMGSNTFINDLIQYAGGLNIFADQFEKSRIVSLEAIISANPEIIIVSAMGTSGDIVFNSIKSEERIKTTSAMKNNRIYKISDSNIIERPGPRIVDGLEELSKIIHPEIFGSLPDRKIIEYRFLKMIILLR